MFLLTFFVSPLYFGIRYNYFHSIPFQVRVAQRSDCHTQQQAVKTISSTGLRTGLKTGSMEKTTLEEKNGDYRYIFSRKKSQEIYIPIRRKKTLYVNLRKKLFPEKWPYPPSIAVFSHPPRTATVLFTSIPETRVVENVLRYVHVYTRLENGWLKHWRKKTNGKFFTCGRGVVNEPRTYNKIHLFCFRDAAGLSWRPVT